MMKNLIVIALIFQSFTISSCAEAKLALIKSEIDSVPSVEPVNKAFLSILEKVIESEKKCSYYSQELMFIIHFQTIDSKKTIQIESIKEVLKLGNELAGFVLNEHIILIVGENLDESIFKRNVGRIGVNFFKSLEENQGTNDVVLDIIEDDSFSVWILENNENFDVIDTFSYCE